MTDLGSVDYSSTDALVRLYLFSQFPTKAPPVQALDGPFLAGLTEFVQNASSNLNLLKLNATDCKDVVDSFWTALKSQESNGAQPSGVAAEPADAEREDQSEHASDVAMTTEEPSEPGTEEDKNGHTALQPVKSENTEDPTADPVNMDKAPLSRDHIAELALKVHCKNSQLSPEERNPRTIGSDSEFLAYIMPDQVPEQIQDHKSLLELYITTQNQPVSRLLSGAHKTLRTEHYKLSLIEGKLGIIHNRIEELRNNDRWSLRQRQRFIDPPRERSHSDHLLAELKWMRSCFVEERKFKVAIDYMLARDAADFVANEQLRPASEKLANTSAMPHKLRKISIVPKDDDFLPLIAGIDGLDGFSEALYTQLEQMPCLDMAAKSAHEYNDLPYVPISKFLVPPEGIQYWHRVILENPQEIPELLTSCEHNEKPSRLFTRGTAANNTIDVRAPKPPDTRYINYRLVTIWLPQDDQNLLSLAKKLSYNWELVSSYLMPDIEYTADIERRTPWQCFERWLQLNPTFEVKDLKGRFAEQARIWLDSSSKAQLAIKRRIAPVGVSADNLQRGHKRLRWSSMFDAMRKVKRKRESQPKGNPMRRQAAIEGAHAQTTQSRGTPTAAELSRIKLERDRAVAEAYAQEQRNQQQQQQQQQHHSNRSSRAAAVAAVTSESMRAGVTRPAASVPASTPTTIAGLPVPNSVAAAAAANAANNGQQFTQEQLQQYISDNRRNMQQQQQQAQAGTTPVKRAMTASAGGTPTQGYENFRFMGGSPQMPKAATFSTGSPVGSPAARQAVPQAGAGVAAARPRTTPLTTQQVAALMNNIAQKHPNLSREQVQQLATQEIQLYLKRRSQAQAAQAARDAQAQAKATVQSRASTPSQPPGSNIGSPASQNSFMR